MLRTRRRRRDATGGQRNRAANSSAIRSCARASSFPLPPYASFFRSSSFILLNSASNMIPLRIALDLPLRESEQERELLQLLNENRADRMFLPRLFFFDTDADDATATATPATFVLTRRSRYLYARSGWSLSTPGSLQKFASRSPCNGDYRFEYR